jgi:hypothetical protein
MGQGQSRSGAALPPFSRQGLFLYASNEGMETYVNGGWPAKRTRGTMPEELSNRKYVSSSSFFTDRVSRRTMDGAELLEASGMNKRIAASSNIKILSEFARS